MSKTVLVVESEPWLAEQFERSLKRHGFDAIVTSNAYSAIDLIDEKQPAVIVMGLLLSGASGVSLLHELQSYTDTARTPVIVCSTSPELTLEDLRPYGVRQLLDTAKMQPNDIVVAVRSALA